MEMQELRYTPQHTADLLQDALNGRRVVIDGPLVSVHEYAVRNAVAYLRQLAAKDAEIEKLRERLDRGREYLMTVEQDEFSADEAFEAFGWTADGLNLSPWAEPRAALKEVK